MATDLEISGFEDVPGAFASVGEALGRAGVNIEGIAGGGGYLHVLVLVEDAGRARQTIEEAGLQVRERDVVLVDVADRPGGWGELGRRIADAGINLDLIYLATRTRIVLGAEDVAALRSAVGASSGS
jgi:hypothetical protein